MKTVTLGFAFKSGMLAVFLMYFLTAVSQTSILMEENRGQWPFEVKFKTDIPGARVFLEEDGVTYAMFDRERLNEIHHESHEKFNDPSWNENDQVINCHALKIKFEGSETLETIRGENPDDAYLNYFMGNDPSKWAGGVPLFKKVVYKNLYDGIDLIFLSNEQGFKYEFFVETGADPTGIKLKYEGAGNIIIKEGNLHIETSINDLIEQKPLAWQITPTGIIIVECKFEIKNNIVGFVFPNGYDENLPIVIDPVVVASTYSGSTTDTYGHCATYDEFGNVYAGGRPFGLGYPTTAGAFQVSFGGFVDISITKLDPTGSTRLYSTFLGGSSSDLVHSMIVDPITNQLCIYGSTNSSNFPTTSGAYDQTYNGAGDIVITKFNSTGTALVGSTYVGGSSNDGTNTMTVNYGDGFRGEIILDASSNIFITSFTSSANFPTTAGAYDQSYNGAQDAVVCSFNPNLTTLSWSTFLGGVFDDGGFGIRVNANGTYVVGATASSDFPTTASSYQAAYSGGTYDGFICRLSGTGSGLLNSTYYGTSSTDEVFFIDTDNNSNIHVYGQTSGTITITPGKYGNAGSQHFIAKFNSTLSALNWQTVFGNSSNAISPTAFMVDNCNHIYASGWGSTSGFPVTPNAIQGATSGDDFYLIVLDTDAANLLYATYYGSSAWDHVDGGTCRFDKNGVVYEAVCTSGTNFPTLPGSVSNTNNTGGLWDIVVFKIDFQLSGVIADAVANPATGCAPLNVSFTNQSTNALSYLWDFGDGNISSLANPSHTFLNPGNYNVMFIAYDPNSCNIADTVYIPIQVTGTIQVNLGPDTTVCTGIPVILDAGNPGATYLWSNNQTTQTISVTNPGNYIVTATSAGCSHTDTINVQFSQATAVSLGPDTTLCAPFNLQLNSGIGNSVYVWSNNATTQSINITSPGTYWVAVGPVGCVGYDTIVVNGIQAPVINLGPDITLCNQSSYTITANAGNLWMWSTGETTQSINVSGNTTVWVEASNNNCSAWDTLNVTFLNAPAINLGPDTAICGPVSLSLNAGSTGPYLWSTNATTQTINVNSAGTYIVTAGPSGCTSSDTIQIIQHIIPVVDLGPDTILCNQSSIPLDASNSGSAFLWSTGATSQIINVNNTATVWVQVSNGSCISADTINLNFITSPIVNLGPDTTLCNPFTLSLNASTGQNYLWSTNATTQTININSAGVYWVQVGPAGCAGFDTIEVNSVSVPVVNLGPDLNLCDQSTQLLDAGNSGLNYLWSNNSTTQTITVTNSGLYYVEVNNGYCSGADSVSINFYTSPVVNLGPDLTICSNISALLDAGNPGSVYQWSDGSNTQVININSSGIYWVTVGQFGCSASDTVVVQIEQAPVVELGNDTILCDVTSFTLDAGYGPGYNYTWAPGGLTTQTITVDETFIYHVIVVSPNGCSTVDDITIYFLETPNVSLGPDINTCESDPVILDAGASGNMFIWSTGDTSQTIEVQNSGNYWVTVGYAACSNSDTISVNFLEIPDPDLGNDTILCNGQQINISTGITGYQHQWSTSEITNSIIINNSGTYIVTVTNQICSGTDTINILFEPMPQFVLSDQLPCVGDSVILHAQNPGFNYLWSTDDNSQTITVTNSGSYYVQIYNSRCSIIDSVSVEYVLFETKDEKINGCDKMEVMLDAGNPGANYNWSEGYLSQQIIVKDTGVYWVIIERNGCRDTSRFEIQNIVGTSNVFLPNAFTPNNDGINELYQAIAYGIESFDLKIFNRWGELVFFSDDPQKGWDGTFESKPLKQDIYVFKIEYQSSCDLNKKVEKVGKLLLLK